MDGTLVDTEPYWIAAETPLVESYGGTWTHEQALELVGNGLEQAAAILQNAGVQLPIDDIVTHLTGQVMDQLAQQGNPFRPGAAEMLKSLRDAGVKTALVTMSLRRMADVVIAQVPFDAFDAVVAGDEVTRPKPFADPYLQACALLGVEPSDVLVIEDSPTGLRAGLAAGAVTLGVPHMVDLSEAGAHGVWDTLAGRSVADLVDFFAEHAAAAGATRA